VEKVVETILICTTCEGAGVVHNEVLTDHHRGEYDSTDEICRTCKGSGRRIKTVTTETIIKPYDNPEVTLLLLKSTN